MEPGIGAAIEKMILFYNGSLHDINHFLKVYAYAKAIGEQEHLDHFDQQALELAAIVHDIACPLCREKYGNANGKAQEREGEPMARGFLERLGYEGTLINRVAYLVAHHHTFHDVDGFDHQILLEADYLVNADESNYSAENIQNAMEKVFKTTTGKQLLKSIYSLP